MRKLFRSFERSGLEYLLISGQASILYGAATFSEDVDIWIRPSTDNARRLLKALASCGARIHKLTPPLTLRHLLEGHGFHFVVPDSPLPAYLDVMGKPPRVGPFASSFRRARYMRTAWGVLPVVSIEDLIALKKTRRFSDYEVISNLVRIKAAQEEPGRSLHRWASRSSFRAEDRARHLDALGRVADIEKLRIEIAVEVAGLQARDARYWSRRIGMLRRLRHQGGLWPDGTPVARLIR